MNVFVALADVEPRIAQMSTQTADEEAMRARLFEQFNAYWMQAASEGVPYDMIGTMSVTAAIFGLLARHGVDTTAEYLEHMVETVRSGMFAAPSRTN